MNQLDVICYGDINVDYIGKMDRLPEKDEELPIHELEKFCGGAATNVAVTLSRLGKKTAYLGSIGGDSSGVELLNRLEKEDVDTSEVVEKSDHLSGMVVAVIDDNGERRMLSHLGANKAMEPGDIRESFIKQAEILHISSSQLEVVSRLIAIAKKHNLLVSFDPGTLASRRGLADLKELLKKVDILFLNRVEYRQLTGSTDIEKLDLFLELGCEIVIYKQGKSGSYVKAVGKSGLMVSGFPVAAVDSTGAGDAFAGGFLAAYLDDLDLKKSIVFANAVGAISVTKKGAKEALPTKEEVEKFIEEKNLL